MPRAARARYAAPMARPPRRTAPTIVPAQHAAIAAALHETRSCVVVVLNRSAHELVLAAATPLRGGFQPAPPARIAPHAGAVFGTQSAAGQGGAGCAAILTYRAGAFLTLSLRFDVPYAGRNAAAATLSGPGSETVAVTSTSGAGHVRVAIEFVVSPAPAENEVSRD